MPRIDPKVAIRWLSRNPIWGFIVIIFVFFSFANPFFFDAQNFKNILVQTSTIGLVALGMTLVMIDGAIDLSVGSVVALSASLAVSVQDWPMFASWGDWAIAPAVLAALAAGVILGAFNGLIVWKTGVDAFIVTLGAMIGVRGLVFVYTKEQSFYASNLNFADFGSSNIGPLPTLAVLFLVCAALIHFLLGWTVHGRNTYAVGGNRAAAINAGLRVGPHMMINFMIVGFFAALAGVTLSSQMGAATPTLGQNYELWVITAVVMGGVKLTGGVGDIAGTLGGVLAIGVLRNGMDLMQVPAFYVLVILGVILIAVMALDRQFNRRGEEELRI